MVLVRRNSSGSCPSGASWLGYQHRLERFQQYAVIFGRAGELRDAATCVTQHVPWLFWHRARQSRKGACSSTRCTPNHFFTPAMSAGVSPTAHAARATSTDAEYR